jgi:hypothetical protein
MASINLTKLKPGKSYIVKVRAKDADGNYSQYSFSYSFTVPATNLDGTQLVSTNNVVVTALAPSSSSDTGGALIAGGLDATGAAQAGALNLGSVWNNTASSIAKLTGTANTGAVIINSTGILGYQLTSTSSGQANFFLDTASGNAYFRGTVYANSGQIGGFLISNSSLSASTYFNKLTSFDPSFENEWKKYWTASADYFGRTDSGLDLKNDETVSPIQAGLRYAEFSVFGVGNSANISASSMEMTMFKTASSKIAFSQSDLGISSGSTYTLSVYVEDLGSLIQSGSVITKLPALIYLKINKYNGSGTSSATLISSRLSSIFTTNTTAWTRVSASFTTASGEYYTFSIINAQDYSPSGSGVQLAESSIAVDAIQLESGNTANSFGFDNYFAVSPADPTKPINLSSISNTGSTSNIFSVYTDGGTYANYFFSNKQSKIGNIYFGGTGSTNISIGDYYATNFQPDANNVNIGVSSLGLLTSGSNNIALGYYAGSQLQYGSNNVFIGKYNLSSELSGSAGGLTPVNNSIFISDGAGNLRIKVNSSGLVTIPGSASLSNLTASGTITAGSFVGNGAGITGITASATGSVTIGSTIIPLNSTTASLSGLSTFDLTNTTSSGTVFSISTSGSNKTGGIINLQTGASSSGAGGSAKGGTINIQTTSTATNTSGATGGTINIQTTGDSSGVAAAKSGDISISTNKGGTTGTSGSITISSDAKFAILANGSNVGTIDNFNIGGTTPGTGNFTALTISGSSVATQAYANSASLNAYNSASTYTSASAYNNTSASVRYASSAGFVSGSNVSGTVASATYSSSANYSSSAGYLPVSGLSASTITIGSTSIGLGNTSASLIGLNTVSIAAGSNNPLSASSQVSNSSLTGGSISLYTNANATNPTSPTGGNISVSTNAGGSGAGAAAGGDIIIRTTSTGNGTPGIITLSAGSLGTIDNFNIGATTAGTGRFTTLTATGATNGTTASYTGQVNANNLVLSSSLTATSASLSGRVTASTFFGDGSALTGISASNSASLGGIAASDYLTINNYYTSQMTPTTSIDLFPRTAISGTRTLSVGSIYSTGFVPVKTFTLNTVTIVLTTAGTSSIQFGLISTSGSTQTVVASTNLAVPSAAGAFTASFATPQTLTAGQSYAIGALAVGGTNPVLVGQTISTTHAAISYGLYPLVAAVSNTTTYTSIPAAGNTIAINTATPPASYIWARLS